MVAKLSMKRFLSGSEKRKRKRKDEKFREKLPKVTQYFQSRIRPWKWKKFLIMFQVHLILFQVLLSQVFTYLKLDFAQSLQFAKTAPGHNSLHLGPS